MAIAEKWRNLRILHESEQLERNRDTTPKRPHLRSENNLGRTPTTACRRMVNRHEGKKTKRGWDDMHLGNQLSQFRRDLVVVGDTG